ncbi:hypothetical protein MMAN_47860 [Mycobacterium mantenii]|uniref:Uncharacterized protein n=1 Tax=Mycobacterium mantenii TaxID=560555 RepID=A0ABM7JYJ5_MYCNT|nr:hypothetical protein MMAN_47860 [Mycobacterium mantenii]
MEFTATWRPATARATLPQTSVEATTESARECAAPLQPVSTVPPANTSAAASHRVASAVLALAVRCRVSAVRTPDFLLPASRPILHTNENRFHYKAASGKRVRAGPDPL